MKKPEGDNYGNEHLNNDYSIMNDNEAAQLLTSLGTSATNQMMDQQQLSLQSNSSDNAVMFNMPPNNVTSKNYFTSPPKLIAYFFSIRSYSHNKCTS